MNIISTVLIYLCVLLIQGSPYSNAIEDHIKTYT